LQGRFRHQGSKGFVRGYPRSVDDDTVRTEIESSKRILTGAVWNTKRTAVDELKIITRISRLPAMRVGVSTSPIQVVVYLGQTARVCLGDHGIGGTIHDRRLELLRTQSERTFFGVGDT